MLGRAALRGALAGLAGTAAMTLAEQVEQSITHRPDSYVPARTLTALTTALGFLSFLTSSIRPVSRFGLFTAAGVLFCLVWSLVATPALLALRPAAIPAVGPPARAARTSRLALALEETYEPAVAYLRTYDMAADGLLDHGHGGTWHWHDWGYNEDGRLIDTLWYYIALKATLRSAGTWAGCPRAARRAGRPRR